MIEIDGEYAEGGGSILRTALALSTVTRKPFRAINVRKNRKEPGLKSQHMHAIKALQELCGGTATGGVIGSPMIEFFPGECKSKHLVIDVGTAGSVTLLLQSLLLPAMFLPRARFTIKGGTDVLWSPQSDYFCSVFLPHLASNAKIEYRLVRRGYYPKGGGEVELTLHAKAERKPLHLREMGRLSHVKGVSHASVDLPGIADRQAATAKKLLSALKIPIDIRVEYAKTLSPGSGITLWASYEKEDEIDPENPITLGSDVLGERGKPSESVGTDACLKLQQLISANKPTDPNLADQLIPYIALFGGSIETSEVTAHTRANIYACEAFLGKIFIVSSGIISSNGFQNNL